MDGSRARRRTRATVLAVLAILMLALPSAALAQSAGDRQYADPLVGDGQAQPQEEPPPTTTQARNDGSGADNGDSSEPVEPAPVPEAAPSSNDTAPEAPPSEETLPHTGSDAWIPATIGLALTMLGALGLALPRRGRHARRWR